MDYINTNQGAFILKNVVILTQTYKQIVPELTALYSNEGINVVTLHQTLSLTFLTLTSLPELNKSQRAQLAERTRNVWVDKRLRLRNNRDRAASAMYSIYQYIK